MLKQACNTGTNPFNFKTANTTEEEPSEFQAAGGKFITWMPLKEVNMEALV